MLSAPGTLSGGLDLFLLGVSMITDGLELAAGRGTSRNARAFNQDHLAWDTLRIVVRLTEIGREQPTIHVTGDNADGAAGASSSAEDTDDDIPR